MRRCFCPGSAGSPAITAADPRSAAVFLNVGTGLDLRRPGACRPWWPKPWATRARFLWDTSKPDGKPPKKTTRRQQAGGPSLEGRFPLAEGLRQTARPMPSRVAHDGRIRSPLKLGFLAIDEGLISAIRWLNGMDGRPRMDCFCSSFVKPIAFKTHGLPLAAGGLPATFSSLCLQPRRFRPRNRSDNRRWNAQAEFCLLLTVARCAVGAAHGRAHARLRLWIHHRFSPAMRSCSHQGLRQPVPSGAAVLRPARPTEEAAGAVSALATNSPTDRRSPHRSVHRSPEPQPIGWAISMLRQSQVLGVEALWGDDIDM